MIRKILLTSLLTFSFCTQAFAAESALEKLQHAKTIRCLIGEGSTSSLENRKLSFKRGDFSANREDSLVTFTKIDVANSTALAVGNSGAEDITVRPAEIGLNFIAFSATGEVIASTVFTNPDEEGNYFFVTSRHVQSNYTSMPSQWTGGCRVVE